MSRLRDWVIVLALLAAVVGCTPSVDDSEATEPPASEVTPRPSEDPFKSLPVVTRNARLLGLEDVSVELEGQDQARISWRIPGFDAGVSEVDVVVTRTDDGNGPEITGLAQDAGPMPLWLAEPIEVRRAPGVLVFGAVGSKLNGLLKDARKARSQVLAFFPDWDGNLVVEVPFTPAGLADSLNGEPGDYDGVAAITSSSDGSRRVDTPNHVFVNADVYADMKATADRIVMTHEVVHVATKAPTVRVPLWWSEGLADYVAFAEVDRRDAAGARNLQRRGQRQLADYVLAEGVPDGLPEEGDFAGDNHGATYESARVAVETLAKTSSVDGGRAALTQFQRLLADGVSEKRAIRQVFGISYDEFVETWQSRLGQDG